MGRRKDRIAMESTYRIEQDMLGRVEISDDAYYGIHTARALENFGVSGRKTNRNLIYAIVLVKKAAAMANVRIGQLSEDKAQAIIKACDDIMAGKLDEHFVVDTLQGGAGTSSNMNVNEVIANRALEIMGNKKGDYHIIHPLDQVNCCQSTNDVYPTALRIAAIKLLRILSESLASLQESLQVNEEKFSNILKLGRTQLMDALPITAGQEFGAYARAVSRDRWRLYKIEERLRETNLGGTAVGTGINAPLAYIYTVTDILQDLSGLGLARSDYPIDNTQNMDVFVEVSGLLKSAAVNLMKIANDMRLLSSGPAGGIGEMKLPAVQAGSSIMPGKVNPVICEMVVQTSMKIISNDTCITLAAASGQLELNAFTPLIAECLLESLEILTRAVEIFNQKCIKGIEIDEKKCREHVESSSALAAALIDYIGYDQASRIAGEARQSGKTIKQVLVEYNIMTEEQALQVLNLFQVTKPGIPGR